MSNGKSRIARLACVGSAMALGATMGMSAPSSAAAVTNEAQTAWKGCKQKTFTDSVKGALGSVGSASVRYAWCWKGNRITSYRVASQSTRVTTWGSVRGYELRPEGNWFRSGGKNRRHVTRMHRVMVLQDLKVRNWHIQTRDHSIKLMPAGKSSHWVSVKNHV